ncbi:MAG: hypothetical protein Q9207_003867 [Kuettlingeria erythrocarpa]
MSKLQKQAAAATQRSTRSDANEKDEDWEQVQDARERKKIQNRIAQRSYRTYTWTVGFLPHPHGLETRISRSSGTNSGLGRRIKRKLEDLDQWHETVAAATAEPAPVPVDDTEPRRNGNARSPSSTQALPVSAGTSALQMPYAGQSPIAWDSVVDPFLSLDSIGDDTMAGVDPATTITPQLQWRREEHHDAQGTGLETSPRCTGFTGTRLAKVAEKNGRGPRNRVRESSEPSEVTLGQDEGKTALHLAAERDELNIARTLLQRMPDPDIQDQLGSTPLFLAVQNNHEEMVRLFLTKGGNINLQDHCAQTILHVAVGGENEKIVALILHAGVDTELKDYTGRTALHIAVQLGNENIMQQLLDRGADVAARVG